MDLFGVAVLAFVTAVFGGILRDLLIGAVPPASICELVLSRARGDSWAAYVPFATSGSPSPFFDAVGLGILQWQARRRLTTG